jgi:Predicted periplasmic ligand-binding sensor domain
MTDETLSELFNEDLDQICSGGPVPQRKDISEEYQRILQTACVLNENHFYQGSAPKNAARAQLLERARHELPHRSVQRQKTMNVSVGLKIFAWTSFVVLLFLGINWTIMTLKPTGAGSSYIIPINSSPSPSIIPSPAPTTLSMPVFGQATPTPGYAPGNLSSPTSVTYFLPTAYRTKTFEPPIVENLITKTSNDSAWTTYYSPSWWDQQNKDQTVEISAIATAKDGSVWFGTMGGPVSVGDGVYRFDGKVWMHYTTKNGLPANEISSIVASLDDSVWFSTLCCGVSHFDGKNWTSYTTVNGLASNDVRSSAVGKDGSLWFGTYDAGVSRFDGVSWKTYGIQDGLWGPFVEHIAVLPDNSLVLSSNAGSTARLDRFDGKNWTDFHTPWESSGGYTEDISAGSDGAVWFATDKKGVYRYEKNSWSHYNRQDDMANNSAYDIIAASAPALWLGTDHGLSRFDGNYWTTYTTQQGLMSNWISSLAQGPDGSIWIGTAGGISRYKP